MMKWKAVKPTLGVIKEKLNIEVEKKFRFRQLVGPTINQFWSKKTREYAVEISSVHFFNFKLDRFAAVNNS